MSLLRFGWQCTDELHSLSLHLRVDRGRNVCLAILAGFDCAGCSYSHERHDVASLDDDELEPVVQQKLQEIQSWFNRTSQWLASPAPISPVPFALAQPPVPYGYSQPQAPYPAKIQEQPKSSFANTDPNKVVEFVPKGLQLPTPTSPQSRESLASVPNEDPAASTIDSVQDSAVFESTASWTDHGTNLSNDGWITPESNPGTNTGDKQPEEPTEGNESTAKFDWAEEADRFLPISPLSWNTSPPTHLTVDTKKGKGQAMTGNTAEPTSQWDWEYPSTSDASKQEPAADITEDIADSWMAEHGLSGGSWFVGTDSTANGWDDPPKVAEPAGDICLDIPPSSEARGANGANEDDWNTVPLKGKMWKKEKEKPFKSPPFTPKPKYKDNGYNKGPVERDWRAPRRGGKEEGNTATWNSAKQGKKGDKPPPTPATKPFANNSTKNGPAKEKRRDQATGPKDVFTYKRSSSSTATLQSTMKHQDEDPDLSELPELPPDLKAQDYPIDFQNTLRQAIVTKCKMPDRPSVAPLPESTNSDEGMNWVNGKHSAGRNIHTPKDFSERKVQMDETTGWVKRSKSKTSPTGNKVENWPKLGK